MSYYRNLNVQSLTDWDACDSAISRIERTAQSYTVPRDFTRGAHCVLKAGAKNKIKAIYRQWSALDLESIT